MDFIQKSSFIVQCSDTGDVIVHSRLESDNPLSFNIDGGIHVMHLEPEVQSCIGVGGKEYDLNLWSLETQQVLNGHRVIVGNAYCQIRIYDSNTKRRPVQQLNNFGENPIQSLCISPDETQVYIGDTAGNLDILDLRTLKHMSRCTGPVRSIRDATCHPTLPYIAAVGLDRMVYVFDVILFCADGLKNLPEGDEPSKKRLKSGDDDLSLDDDDDDDLEEEAYEGLENSDDEDDNANSS
ncbi:putative WD40/YVTN repeat-like-containing domain superfamily [Plasmopara halstedii]